ncbi:MAG: Xaa-Pro peptidase family protein [bacterium]|nr:Xaa-Pro peptidase family protein [bacterium]
MRHLAQLSLLQPAMVTLGLIAGAATLAAQEPDAGQGPGMRLPPPGHARLPDRPLPPAIDELRERRTRLAALLAERHPGERIVVLLRGALQTSDMGAFKQDQNFLYLTGVAEPHLALLIVIDETGRIARDELLVPPFSRFAATWDGTFLAPGEATAERTGFRTAGNVRSLHRELKELLTASDASARPAFYTSKRPSPSTGSTPSKAATAAAAIKRDRFDGRESREERLVQQLEDQHEGLRALGIEAPLRQLRARKSLHEIGLLRASTQIAAEGIAEAIKSTRPGMFEYQVAAVARYVFSLRGCGPDAYAAIVGGGPNGCILHYNACSRRLLSSDLIVMDYAGTLHGYASDVTRTFPASGKFTAEQRKLVTDVHEIQQQLLAMVKPGASLRTIGRRCRELLMERGYRSDHGPCHHVGLAVHDPSVDELEPGMVITVEPGAYLRKVGMGCRIEDTVLVTADGHENLSGHLPSDPDGIERLMAESGIVSVPVGLPNR